ncbi:MAG: outer-membrane lipoprotein carrier protein LolA, partial [Mariprofundaceae bacterium]
WRYDSPYEQLYVSDGKVIWHYEPDLMQAERMQDLEAVDPIVMKLLDGRLTLKDAELLERVRDEAAGVWRFRARLGTVEVWLGVDDDADLIYVERLDALGNRNRISLSGCARLAPKDELFRFQPPRGVEVLDAD